jgi:SAM-dependent methyltransferase
MVKDAELERRWREALLLEGESDLIQSGVRELAEYFGISRLAAQRACLAALGDSKREWEAAPRETRQQIEDFYRHTRSYLFEHVWWHAHDARENAANVALLDYARSLGAREYLDFGSGVGANALLFASAGFKVTLADISPPLLAFACWRLWRRGLRAEFIDLNQRALPQRRFAFATAVDVLEHLVEPGAALQQLSEALVPGGTLVFNCRAGYDAQRPMHILRSQAPIYQPLRRCSLRALEEPRELATRGYHVVRRFKQSRWLDWWYGAFDFIYYSDRMQVWLRRT